MLLEKELKNKNNYKLVNNYSDYILYNRSYSQNTYYHYRSVIIKFLDYIDPVDLFECNIEMFEKFFMQKKQNLSNSSKNNYIVVLRNFFKYVSLEQGCKVNFIEKIESLKNKYELKLPFTIKETKKIFSKLENDNTSFLIKLLYYSGIRVSEAINILIVDVNLNNQTIKILGKGDKYRIIFLPSFLIMDVKHNVKHNKNFLIEENNKPIYRQRVNVLLKEFKNKHELEFDLHPHKFRRSLATHLIENDMDIRQIQVYLGHSSILSTEKYVTISRNKLKNKMLQAFSQQNK